MTWRDREYARESDFAGPYRPAMPSRPLLGGRSVVTLLIWTNIVIFVLATLTGGRFGVHGSPIAAFLELTANEVRGGQIWRVITAQYLHWDTFHILFNMLGLHFLGRQFEIDWGSRMFLAVYTTAGLIGNLFLLVLTFLGWFNPDVPAAGASGCVLGLLGAAAVRYPRAEVLIYFLFPMKMRTVALIFAGLYAINLFNRGTNAGGDACHIAGLAFGAWWAWRGEYWFSRRGWSMPSFRSRKPYRRPSARAATFQDRVRQRQDDAETVDRILKKVYDSGVHSLSEAEKRALQEATERQKAMES